MVSGPGDVTIGTPCVFPFRYRNEGHTKCTTMDNGDKPWCSTETDMHGNYMAGKWGNCGDCPTGERERPAGLCFTNIILLLLDIWLAVVLALAVVFAIAVVLAQLCNFIK